MVENISEVTVEAHHKRPNYLVIFGALALITVIEVTLATNMPLLLLVLSLSKVVLVAMYYMHLKFETGWFTAIFLTPVPFVALIVVALIVALTPGVEGSAAVSGVCSFW